MTQYICRCGYHASENDGASPRFCTACGQPLRVGDFEHEKSIRVLIVEDSTLIRRRAKDVLESLGCAVEEADNGKKALAMIKINPPALVISDILMPDMDGLSMLSNLREDIQFKDLPVALLTSEGRGDIIGKAMKLGVLGYILKDNFSLIEERLKECVMAVNRLVAKQIKPRILVAEDSATLRKALVQILQAMGCDVAEAADGKQALASIQAQRPDLLLSDIEMSEMDGIELLKTIRRDLNLKDIPVIILTTLSDDEHITQTMNEGVMAYIIKTEVTPASLRQQLKHHITTTVGHI